MAEETSYLGRFDRSLSYVKILDKSQMPENVPCVTVPMFQFVPRDNTLPPGDRLRPDTALNFKKMIPQLERDVIYEEKIGRGRWAVMSVVSSYTQTMHVMVMELSTNRYLP
eukprot:Colp12_sorted_trinity150504_noHs@26645